MGRELHQEEQQRRSLVGQRQRRQRQWFEAPPPARDHGAGAGAGAPRLLDAAPNSNASELAEFCDSLVPSTEFDDLGAAGIRQQHYCPATWPPSLPSTLPPATAAAAGRRRRRRRRPRFPGWCGLAEMLVNSSASSESSEEVAAQVLSGLKASGEDDPCGWLTNDDGGGGGCSEMVPIVFMCEAPIPTRARATATRATAAALHSWRRSA